jgi:hypothetical protein
MTEKDSAGCVECFARTLTTTPKWGAMLCSAVLFFHILDALFSISISLSLAIILHGLYVSFTCDNRYCQSMNFIAAMLLIVFSLEEEVRSRATVIFQQLVLPFG